MARFLTFSHWNTMKSLASVTALGLTKHSCSRRLIQSWTAGATFRGCFASNSHALTVAHALRFSSAVTGVREQMEYDVCVVGAGPAGLAAALQLKQKCKASGKELSVCVVEKASTVGAHILSGCVMDPRALSELVPDWKEDPTCPVGKVPAARDSMRLLATPTLSLRLPVPPPLRNKGNYVVSLSEVTRWLAAKAEAAGVEIYPGFAANKLLRHWDGHVVGVATNDFGIAKDGSQKPNYTPGVDVRARVTLLGEGARGSLSQEAIRRFSLRDKAGAEHQTYALGLKEVWEVPPAVHRPGTVEHTMGWPLGSATYGGGFIYHMDGGRVALGLVISLSYDNPHLNTFQEFQRWKTHPAVRRHIEGGTCVQYGARTLNEGGLQSLPQLSFPGGALIGCSAGFLNVARIKGSHLAMLSGMTAGEAAFRALTDEKALHTGPVDLSAYQTAMENSWVWEELRRVRNVRPGFRAGLLPGLVHAAANCYVTRGAEPWTLSHGRPDHDTLRPASESAPIAYPKPDGKVTFDLPTQLYRSGTNHEHDQPPHLVLKDAGAPERHNYRHYAGPEARYCPAGVYEYSQTSAAPGSPPRPHLTINAQNCLHCKACDIKDPLQNIQWTVPEGGGGPNYSVM